MLHKDPTLSGVMVSREAVFFNIFITVLSITSPEARQPSTNNDFD
jgi:hypothetical protein